MVPVVSSTARVFRAPLAVLFACVFALASVHASDSGRYRDFVLRSSVAAVRAITGANDRELLVRFDRPTALQRLEWRLPLTAGTGGPTDPVRDVVFDFVGDQLYRITVSYDERKTEGLTHADVLASLEAVYGPRTAGPKATRSAVPTLGEVALLAQWRSSDTVVSLKYVGYSASYQLQLSSVSLELAARAAERNALALEAREAPERAAVIRKQHADEDRSAREKAREQNKVGFQP